MVHAQESQCEVFLDLVCENYLKTQGEPKQKIIEASH